ncbi:uncharacterized protein EI90DRAFT_1756399 [Cantharellus anzutake]|uniref:uncharacterized protein n=1 Tax=Cantharellus anzutake TaxID=1750568 RepID=UPI0019084F92|nr:uncharacterized protein EI90DRAFT_1756399 [Cantharellus anzutake]KAF8341573.1 hypothetical protein EI90DRAFT_1756399 [Cantharellus anzutake]
MPYLGSMAKSISSMVLRSDSRVFRSQAKEAFKTLLQTRERGVNASWMSLSSLRKYRGSDPVIDDNTAEAYRMSLPMNNKKADSDDTQIKEFEDTIIDAMRRLYHLSISPKQFKTSSVGQKDNMQADDFGFEDDPCVDSLDDTPLNDNLVEELECVLPVDIPTGSNFQLLDVPLHACFLRSDFHRIDQNSAFEDDVTDDYGSDAFPDTVPDLSLETSWEADASNLVGPASGYLDMGTDDSFEDACSDVLFTPPRVPASPQVVCPQNHINELSQLDHNATNTKVHHQRPDLVADDEFSDIMSDLLLTPIHSRFASPRIVPASPHSLDIDSDHFSFDLESVGCFVEIPGEETWDEGIEDGEDMVVLGLPASPLSSLSFGSGSGYSF